MEPTIALLINAIAVSIGPTIAIFASMFFSARTAKRVADAAEEVRKATVIAAVDLAKAQERASQAAKDAAEAARLLVAASRHQDATLEAQDKVLDEISETGRGTHKIVNNQRTAMLALVSELRHRIAKENPKDDQAQLAAKRAEDDALRSIDKSNEL